MNVELPDGTVIEDVPDGISKRELAVRLQRNGMNVPQEWFAIDVKEPPKVGLSRDEGAATALGEAAASLGTGALATPVAGLAGLGRLARGEGLDEAVDAFQFWQDKLTYAPRSQAGQGLTNAVAWPFQKIEEGTDWAGGKVTDWTGSPELGAGTKVGLNFLPQIVAKGLQLKRQYGAAQELKRSGQQMDRVEPTMSSAQTAPARRRIMMGSPEQRALPMRAETPEGMSLERISRGEKLPVPVELTKGQATRNPQQLRAEENLAQTDAGRSIRDRHIEQNKALVENLETLRARAGPKSMSLEDIGKRLAQDKPKGAKTDVEGALAMGERKSLENVNRLYDKARASPEGQRPVTPQPLIDWLTDNGAAAASVPEIKSMADMLKKFGAVDFDGNGNPIARRDLTLNQMEELRKFAVKLQGAEPGTPRSHFMGELKRVIDWTTHDSGGDLYKAARAARTQHAMKFEEPRLISDLLGTKSRTDRAVALEKVWDKTVLGGSIADIQRVRDLLLSPKDRMLRDAGRKAWRDVAAQTVEYIKTEATKGVAPMPDGTPNVSPAALKKAVERIGDKKLDMILGKSSADQLRNVVAVAQDVKTLPPYKGGSSTVPNVLSMLDRVVGKAAAVPIVGPIAGGAIRMGQSAYKQGLATKQAQEALQPFRPAGPKKPGLGVRLSDFAGKNPMVWGVVPSIGLQPPERAD